MLNKKIAICQSNYIPWKGYFDLLNRVDEFVLFDDMQYTRRDWRNRNKIKTAHGPRWLTIPVEVKGKYDHAIKNIKVSDRAWGRKHWDTLRHSYSKAPFFPKYQRVFEHLLLGSRTEYLSEINYECLRTICGLLGIQTKLTWSMDYAVACEDRTERLVEICKAARAKAYFSGPSAASYIDKQIFDSAGIELHFVAYSDYPEYEQLYPPFDHYVSIVDLLFMVGPGATNYMTTFGRAA